MSDDYSVTVEHDTLYDESSCKKEGICIYVYEDYMDNNMMLISVEDAILLRNKLTKFLDEIEEQS